MRANIEEEVQFLSCGSVNRIFKVKQIKTKLKAEKYEISFRAGVLEEAIWIGLQEDSNRSVSFKNMVGSTSFSSKYFL